VSAPHSLAHDGPTISFSSRLAVPEGFNGFFDGERSSGESAWSTRAVTGDSLCSSQSVSVVFVFVLLLPFAACNGRL
jgi:hypothetical protein